MLLTFVPGNENQPLNNAAPAGCPKTIAVTSVAQDDGSINLQNQASSFSNYLSLQSDAGPPLWTPDKMKRTIAAPGGCTSADSLYRIEWWYFCMVLLAECFKQVETDFSKGLFQHIQGVLIR